MLDKRLIYRGRDVEREIVLCQPLLPKEMEKVAFDRSSSKLHPSVKKFVHTVQPSKHGIYVLVSAMGSSEYWGQNSNGDIFYEDQLCHAPSGWNDMPVTDQTRIGKDWEYGYPTFMGAHPFQHHKNKDASQAFGRVVLAIWNPEMHRVELVIYLDRNLARQFGAESVIERVEGGEFPDVSMGCRVPFDVCTICGHKSKTRKDYCNHTKYMMNRILADGRKVGVINIKPRFFDISFVFIGADKIAKTMAKVAQLGNQLCLGDYCVVPRSSAEVGEYFPPLAAESQVLHDNAKVADIQNPLLGLVNVNITPLGGSEAQQLWSAYASILPKFENVDESQYLGKLAKQREQTKKSLNSTRYFWAKEKRAGGKVKRQTTFDGHTIKVEFDQGDTRTGVNKATGEKWERVMHASYGYIPKTRGDDGEAVDVYLAPEPKSGSPVYVVHQKKKDGGIDEDKVMLGFSSKESAKSMYMRHVPEWCFGSIEELTQQEFSEYLEKFEKTAGTSCSSTSCTCGCEDSLSKLAHAIFPGTGEKTSSQRKVSEILKSIPAGSFSRETLPKLESAEPDIPRVLVSLMSTLGLGPALSTSGMMGIVLKPHEFQRLLLTSIGSGDKADELDRDGVTFGHTDEVDDSLAVHPEDVNHGLKEKLLPLLKGRSAAAPALSIRIMRVTISPSPAGGEKEKKDSPVLKKIAAAYNGYRRSLLKKATDIQKSLVSDPLLRAELFGRSLVTAFAGGVEKTASASVFSPDSLAYLMGAHYQNRDFHTAENAVLGFLAHTGAFAEGST